MSCWTDEELDKANHDRELEAEYQRGRYEMAKEGMSVEHIRMLAEEIRKAEQRGYLMGFAAGKKTTWLEVKKDLDEMSELLKSRAS